jgi:hypothetical protein
MATLESGIEECPAFINFRLDACTRCNRGLLYLRKTSPLILNAAWYVLFSGSLLIFHVNSFFFFHLRKPALILPSRPNHWSDICPRRWTALSTKSGEWLCQLLSNISSWFSSFWIPYCWWWRWLVILLIIIGLGISNEKPKIVNDKLYIYILPIYLVTFHTIT